VKSFVLEYLATQYPQYDHVARVTQDVGDLCIHFKDGRKLAVYVVNEGVRYLELKQWFEQNTAKRVYTLVLIDGRQLPADNSELEPPLWAIMLHALTQGRFYAYWCDGRAALTVRPIHMDWQWGSKQRTILYGPSVDLALCAPRTVEVSSNALSGRFAVADFADAPFWKKQGEPRQQAYTWRQWRTAEPRKQRAEPPPQQEQWGDWEAFERNFNDYFEQQRQRAQGQRQRSATAYHTPLTHHYQTLGVTASATYDEIKRAYRAKAREFHPDLHPENRDHYTRKMATINAAFEAISKALDE
jgi:hypothetical protein